MHVDADMRLNTGTLAQSSYLHDAMLNGEENTWCCDWLAQRPVIDLIGLQVNKVTEQYGIY